jgi:hypothetical protein
VEDKLVKEGWSITVTDDMSVQSVPGIDAGQPMAYAEAVEALHHLHQADPVRVRGLRLLRLSELR